MSSPARRRWHPMSMAHHVVALGVGIALWEIGVVFSDGWVPSTFEVGRAVAEQAASPEFYTNLAITLKRVGITFVACLLIACIVGTAMGTSKTVRALLRPLVVIGLAIPDPVTIILAVLILGISESSGLIAMVVEITPFIVVIVAGAVESRDAGLDEMGHVYRLSTRRWLSDVVARQIAPSLMVAARTSFLFLWKVVILMEALTQSDGIGPQIQFAFRLFRPDDMIAVAVLFILAMQLIDWMIFRRVEQRALSWM